MAHKPKPYARMGFSEDEFQAVRGAVIQQRAVVFKAWQEATDPKEKEFYSGRVDFYDALLREHFDKVLIADTSQDAEPDDEDEETT